MHKKNKKCEIEFHTLILLIIGSIFIIALLIGIIKLIRNIVSG